MLEKLFDRIVDRFNVINVLVIDLNVILDIVEDEIEFENNEINLFDKADYHLD